MRLGGDRRAQSVQIGAIILFGFLVVALSTYQAAVVPQENAAVEFRHSQAAQDDLVGLGNSIDSTGRTGEAAPAAVKLGTRYPTRVFAVNPPPAAGSLRTAPGDNVTVSGVEVVSTSGGEANDYWSTERNFSTNALVYRPGYHEYDESPVTRYEATGLVNEFDGGTLLVDEPTVVRGNRITLVTLRGTLSEEGVGLVSVDPSAVSAIDRRETVTGDVALTVPSTLGADAWRTEVLADELAAGWVNETTQAGPNRIRIELNASRTYSLGLAAVGVGTDASATSEPAYIDVERAPGAASTGSVREVVVEVRDEYGNPVGNQQVSGATTGGSGSLVDTTVTTDDAGRAVFEYRATGTGTATLRASYDGLSGFDADAPADATTSFPVSGGGTGVGNGTYDLVWDVDRIDDATGVEYVASNDTVVIDATVASSPVDVTVRASNRAGEPIEGATVDYATSNATVARFPAGSSTGETGSDGRATVQLSIGDGDGEVYASVGGTSDSLGVRVVGGAGGDPLPSGAVAYDDANGNGAYDEGELAYTASQLRSFQQPSVDLVVERDAEANGFDVTAGSITVEPGATMTVESFGSTTLRAENGDVRLAGTVDGRNAGGSEVRLIGDGVDASGGTILAAGSVTVTGQTGAVALDAASIDTSGGNGRSVTVTADTDVSARNAAIVSTEQLRIEADGGPLDANGASLDTSPGNQAGVTLGSNGDMTLTDAELVGDEFSTFTADLTVASATLFVDGSEIKRGNGDGKELTYDPDGATVGGSPAVGTVSAD
ncbi:Ig-like domain-containing protein [Halorarum halobium]|uniref:Ig-like domain-containing protein n=1 Tax=Halorarum halobium TaxID=3075121 RepID=UPI0028ACD77F|nr:hypothetical protein [Halobaculum sp. XH14]